MMRFCAALVIIALLGCAGPGGSGNSDRFTGRVAQVEKVPRGNEPSNVLLAFGLIGGLAHATTPRVVETNLYTVKIADDDFVWVQSDRAFATNDCVEVIPRKRAPGSKSFPHGYATVVDSARCR